MNDDTGMHNGPVMFGLSVGFPWQPNKFGLNWVPYLMWHVIDKEAQKNYTILLH